MNNSLWAGMRIPILLVSGEVNSGKSLFGLTIDPNCREPIGENKPTTLVYDNEGSCEPYVGGLNFDWRDVRRAVAEGLHMMQAAPDKDDPLWRQTLLTKPDVKDSPSASLFRAWYMHLLTVKPGYYAVGFVDTFTPIQDGLVEWVRRHPEAFGRSEAQYKQASAMFLWPDVKTVLSYILATDCRLRFETFVMSVHLKNKWSGGSKTGERIAEGLDVLEKLATLHLELDRTPAAKGRDAPRLPSAIVKKERLVRFSADGDMPILPPRLPEATPAAIRAYIAKPPDFSKLKADERLPDISLTDDEKLQIQAQIAADNRASEEAKVSQIEIMRKAAGAQAHVQAIPAQATTATTPEMATPTQIAELERRLLEAFDDPATARDWFLAGSGGRKPHEIPASAMDDCLIKVCQLAAANIQKRAEAKLVTDTPRPWGDKAAAWTPQDTAEVKQRAEQLGNGEITPEQLAEMKRLSEELKIPRDELEAYLRSQKVSSHRSLTFAEANNRIAYLASLKRQAELAAEGDEAPF